MENKLLKGLLNKFCPDYNTQLSKMSGADVVQMILGEQGGPGDDSKRKKSKKSSKKDHNHSKHRRRRRASGGRRRSKTCGRGRASSNSGSSSRSVSDSAERIRNHYRSRISSKKRKKGKLDSHISGGSKGEQIFEEDRQQKALRVSPLKVDDSSSISKKTTAKTPTSSGRRRRAHIPRRRRSEPSSACDSSGSRYGNSTSSSSPSSRSARRRRRKKKNQQKSFSGSGTRQTGKSKAFLASSISSSRSGRGGRRVSIEPRISSGKRITSSATAQALLDAHHIQVDHNHSDASGLSGQNLNRRFLPTSRCLQDELETASVLSGPTPALFSPAGDVFTPASVSTAEGVGDHYFLTKSHVEMPESSSQVQHRTDSTMAPSTSKDDTHQHSTNHQHDVEQEEDTTLALYTGSLGTIRPALFDTNRRILSYSKTSSTFSGSSTSTTALLSTTLPQDSPSGSEPPGSSLEARSSAGSSASISESVEVGLPSAASSSSPIESILVVSSSASSGTSTASSSKKEKKKSSSSKERPRDADSLGGGSSKERRRDADSLGGGLELEGSDSEVRKAKKKEKKRKKESRAGLKSSITGDFENQDVELAATASASSSTTHAEAAGGNVVPEEDVDTSYSSTSSSSTFSAGLMSQLGRTIGGFGFSGIAGSNFGGATSNEDQVAPLKLPTDEEAMEDRRRAQVMKSTVTISRGIKTTVAPDTPRRAAPDARLMNYF
ncbi:unnamed protein product [Amoebophrya sp. A25]|nr:unnamed protein product [Amoebophrya sp. A25]|eukprot:GSA25T00019402001.1